MSGYVLLKAVIVPSASVAWAQLYQMTSPSFFAAGTILLFHSVIAAWNFAGDAVVSTGAAAGGLLCARSMPGASAPATTTDANSPDIISTHRRLVIELSLRRRRHFAARSAPLGVTRRASHGSRAGAARL